MENEELYGIKPAVRDQLDADVFMILSEFIEMLKDFNYEEEGRIWATGSTRRFGIVGR